MTHPYDTQKRNYYTLLKSIHKENSSTVIKKINPWRDQKYSCTVVKIILALCYEEFQYSNEKWFLYCVDKILAHELVIKMILVL